jgi:thiol-disulfide isomerase/thioredoxin
MRFQIPSTAARFLVAVICPLSLCAGASAADPPSAVLHLANDSFVAGKLRGSDDATILRWHSPFFARPFDFPLTAVNAVHYAVSGPQPRPDGDYGFELLDDDVLYGNLLGLTDDEVEVESTRFGKVRLRRELVRRIYRTKGADSIYLGPNGLAGWKDSSNPTLWRDEGGQLFTDKPGAVLFADLGIPEKAVIELELSWKKKPDFAIDFGVKAPGAVPPAFFQAVGQVLRNNGLLNNRGAELPETFHLEVWDNDLVAVGEATRDADIASVQTLAAGAGYIRLQMYLDQKQRRLIVLSHGGKLLANLQIRSKIQPQAFAGLRLSNKKGDVRLEYLRITRWNGLPPHEVREDQLRVHRADGSIIYGSLTEFDPKTKRFTIDDGETETTVPQNALTDIFLSPSQPGAKAADASNRTLRVVYRDGSRFSGTPTRIADGRLWLACPGIRALGAQVPEKKEAEPLRLPLAGLRSLVVLRHEKPPAAPPLAGRAGRLEMDGITLKGQLAGGREQTDASCLVWQPDLGRNASALRPGVAGHIVYRDPPPPRPQNAQNPQTRAVAEQNNLFAKVIANLKGGLATATPAPIAAKQMLHLRSGDTIPCEVRRVTEQGVEFKTPLSDATFVAHEKVKSVDLIAANKAPTLDDTKRDRLLTLPRLLKDSPPTHLIYSRSGDFLRGRVLEMDDKVLKVEVRLETRVIPRDRVAQIIWFHSDELTDPMASKPAPAAAQTMRVQAMRSDGIRLTFVAERADAKTVFGTSDVLGACRAEYADVDQLLFGPYIEQSAAKLAHHLWKLHHATEPKFVQADAAGGDGALTGRESPLVGQPAFAFQLDMIDGKPFQLAQHKGKVVIVEFWATWCGPCLQSMPSVDALAREFAERGVELVAVNMEEQPEQVKAMLERHKLKMTVALDRDGAIAARYAVTAIPQTVVVDRDGKIARLFIGGGKKTEEGLRKALQELLDPPQEGTQGAKKAGS